MGGAEAKPIKADEVAGVAFSAWVQVTLKTALEDLPRRSPKSLDIESL